MKKQCGSDSPKCLTPKCERAANSCRGLCSACYNTAKLMVDNGEASWELLQEAKLIKPPHDKAHRVFREAFSSFMAKKKTNKTRVRIATKVG